MKIPLILNTNEYLDSPLNYKWDNKTSSFYTSEHTYNDKIAGALLGLNHKAILAMIVALSE